MNIKQLVDPCEIIKAISASATRAHPGETRTWGGKRYQKQVDGKWKLVAGEKKHAPKTYVLRVKGARGWSVRDAVDVKSKSEAVRELYRLRDKRWLKNVQHRIMPYKHPKE